MVAYHTREELLQIAAEKMRLKREKEAQEEKEFYERITSGWRWLMFKVVVAICTLLMLIFTIDTFVDGKTIKISESEAKTSRTWEWTWHKVLDVKGCMFAPELNDWHDRVENTLKLTYSPILQAPKILSYDLKKGEHSVVKHSEWRHMSFFNWFPFLQLFLLLPLATLIFKRQAAWFNFARIASMIFVLPGAIIVLIFALG